jgi:PAS domain S-box-containing protein
MQAPRPHKNELKRQEALDKLCIIDTLEEQYFNDLVDMAVLQFSVPIALVTLVDRDRQWFKAKHGLSVRETPRNISFCGHAIHSEHLFIIEDAHLDERFKDNPLVTGAPHLRFYAGAPIINHEGYALGTFCLIDVKPRTLNPKEKEILRKMAANAMHIIQLRTSHVQLVRINQQVNALLENMTEGMTYHNNLGHIEEYNAAAEQILGQTSQQIKNFTHSFELLKAMGLDGETLKIKNHPAMLALRTGKQIKNTILSIEHEHKEKKWIQVTATPLFSDNQEYPTHVLCTYTDINDAKVRESNLIYSSKMSALGEMSAGMAHEINNPLTIISGNAALAKRELQKLLGTNSITPRLERIEETCLRIQKIVNGLKAFSCQEQNQEKLPHNLVDILNETIDLCSEKFQSHGITFAYEASGDTNVQCNHIQVAQILINLLSNAHDAAEAQYQKWIHVFIDGTQEDKVILRVTDSGTGISLNLQKKIMQPFFTTKTIGKGTGLGLSISEGYAKEHKGRLYLDVLSINTSFVLELPRTKIALKAAS